jgi:hypothetical protein
MDEVKAINLYATRAFSELGLPTTCDMAEVIQALKTVFTRTLDDVQGTEATTWRGLFRRPIQIRDIQQKTIELAREDPAKALSYAMDIMVKLDCNGCLAEVPLTNHHAHCTGCNRRLKRRIDRYGEDVCALAGIPFTPEAFGEMRCTHCLKGIDCPCDAFQELSYYMYLDGCGGFLQTQPLPDFF